MSIFRRRLMMHKGEYVPPYDAEIEYLEKQVGANSLINLGTGNDAIFEITAQATGTSNTSMVLFCRNRIAEGGTWFGVPTVKNRCWGLGTISGQYSNAPASNKTDISVDFTVNPVVGTINGSTFSRGRGSGTGNWLLFGADGNAFPFIGRVYALKAYIGGKLALDLIPVRVGQVGYMFNKVNKQLLGNMRTDDFILGNDI